MERKKSTTGMTETAEESTREFRKALRGGIIRPGDDEYENARRLWNGMIDKHPAMIVRCAGVADVITAVNFARRKGIPVSVRGGGHNVAGNALCDDGMVIDLSRMKAIRVDPATGHARAEGEPVRFLLISGRPIREPVAWYGPIVMNSEEELEVAFEEYRNGTFIK